MVLWEIVKKILVFISENNVFLKIGKVENKNIEVR